MTDFTWDVLDTWTDDDGATYPGVAVVNGAIQVHTQELVDGVGNSIEIPPAAIGSRMALYGLDDSKAGFEAVLREHGCRESDAIATPTELSKDALGGLNTAVAIAYQGTSEAQVDEALATCDGEIRASAAARWNEPMYCAARDGGGVPTPPPPSLPPALPPPAQSPAAVAQAMASTIHDAVASVPDSGDTAQLRDAITSALAPYLDSDPAAT